MKEKQDINKDNILELQEFVKENLESRVKTDLDFLIFQRLAEKDEFPLYEELSNYGTYNISESVSNAKEINNVKEELSLINETYNIPAWYGNLIDEIWSEGGKKGIEVFKKYVNGINWDEFNEYKNKILDGSFFNEYQIVTNDDVEEDLNKIFKFNKNNGTLNGYVDEIKDGLKNKDPKFNKCKDLVIPAEIDGVKVYCVRNRAFEENNLTSVIIPKGVIEIGYHAFANNQLTEVIIPEGVNEISCGAFYNNKLTSVNIPESLKEIGWWAFGYNQLTSVNIPEGVKKIGANAFSNNQLTSVTIPKSVDCIWNGAFEENNLTSVNIPDNVVEIETHAFDDDVEVITNEDSSSMKM